jgi:hypothetical protein
MVMDKSWKGVGEANDGWALEVRDERHHPRRLLVIE